MTLSMVHLPISTRTLYASGREQGLVKQDWSVDTGYLVHALCMKLFGEAAPKPFDIQTPQDSSSKSDSIGEFMSVLAYTSGDHHSLELMVPSDMKAAIAWDRANSKLMPTVSAGQRLGFRVRICPIVRIGKHHPRFAAGAEVDPYVAAVQRKLAEAELTTVQRKIAEPGPISHFSTDGEVRACRERIIADLPSREDIYRDWLAARFNGAATMQTARLVSLRDAQLWRKGQPGAGAASRMQGQERARRGARSLIGRREAIFDGELSVDNPDAFSALLGRGIGRHRAFGLGMLLLRPPARD